MKTKSTKGETKIGKGSPGRFNSELVKRRFDQLIHDPAFKHDPKREEAIALNQRYFMTMYGAFLLLWQEFELMMEIAIMRELNLTADVGSALCASLAFQAKFSTLLALLRRDQSNKSKIAAVKTAQKVAKRNAFVHGFILNLKEDPRIRLVNRTNRNGKYKVTSTAVGMLSMVNHAAEFMEAFEAAGESLGISIADIDAYLLAIEAQAS
jgi:hypothetical protein